MIVRMERKLAVTALLLFFSCFIFVLSAFPVMAGADGVEYSTHVENIGWQDYVTDGATAGTEGQSLRLEALKIRLKNPSELGIEYRTHVANEGWQDYTGNDQISGTEGRGLQLEAVSIRLTGSESPNYNIYYRVHAQDYGWLGWAKNGEDAGTTGMSKRLEAIQILLKPASEAAPEQSGEAFVSQPAPSGPDPNAPDQNSPVHYRALLSGTEWSQGHATNGAEIGPGDVGRIDAITVGLSDQLYQRGGVQYKVCGSGNWTSWVENDQPTGGPGDAIQAVRIRLTSQLPYLYDVYYRVHVPGVGWSNFARNGGAAGSEGLGRGISLIQIFITGKGDAPGAIDNAFTQAKWYWPLDGITSISSGFGPRDGSHHDGIDIPAGAMTPIHSVKAGTVRIAGPNGDFGNCVAIENDSGEFCYYAHMARVGTQVGAHVEKGQVIGFVGNTGHSFGNHLHLEVYDDNGNLVNPLNYY